MQAHEQDTWADPDFGVSQTDRQRATPDSSDAGERGGSPAGGDLPAGPDGLGPSRNRGRSAWRRGSALGVLTILPWVLLWLLVVLADIEVAAQRDSSDFPDPYQIALGVTVAVWGLLLLLAAIFMGIGVFRGRQRVLRNRWQLLAGVGAIVTGVVAALFTVHASQPSETGFDLGWESARNAWVSDSEATCRWFRSAPVGVQVDRLWSAAPSGQEDGYIVGALSYYAQQCDNDGAPASPGSGSSMPPEPDLSATPSAIDAYLAEAKELLGPLVERVPSDSAMVEVARIFCDVAPGGLIDESNAADWEAGLAEAEAVLAQDGLTRVDAIVAVDILSFDALATCQGV